MMQIQFWPFLLACYNCAAIMLLSVLLLSLILSIGLSQGKLRTYLLAYCNCCVVVTGLQLELRGTNFTSINNTVLMLDSIGEGDEEALICRTDLRDDIGEWLDPDGNMVPENMMGHGLYQDRNTEGEVFLRRRQNVTPPLGTYCCMASIENDTETFCVGKSTRIALLRPAHSPS